jgi:dihydrofolate synthase/folylpolyglutamate synthase
VRLSARGAFQRRNFALATAAAEAFLGALDPDRVAEVASTLTVPGRLEKVLEDPPTFLDAAHNPDGARALAEALGELGLDPAVACLAILADKDAEGIVAALAPALDRAVCAEIPADGTKSGNMAHSQARRRSTPAAELATLCEAAGVGAEAEPDLYAALQRARSLAAGPPQAALVVTGSHYVLGPARAALT